jgi:hypothetical protein
MEAVHTSETSVNFNVTTWRYITEDSKLKLVFTSFSKAESEPAYYFHEAPDTGTVKQAISS